MTLQTKMNPARVAQEQELQHFGSLGDGPAYAGEVPAPVPRAAEDTFEVKEDLFGGAHGMQGSCPVLAWARRFLRLGLEKIRYGNPARIQSRTGTKNRPVCNSVMPPGPTEMLSDRTAGPTGRTADASSPIRRTVGRIRFHRQKEKRPAVHGALSGSAFAGRRWQTSMSTADYRAHADVA